MTSYEIKFLPDEKSVDVEAGTTLMEAADKAGVYINALCGYTAEEKFEGDICPQCGMTFWKCDKCGFMFTAL
jgi:rubrerythrin